MFMHVGFLEHYIVHKKKRGNTGYSFLEIIVERVLLALNVTSQLFAHLNIVSRSALRILAAVFRHSTTI